MHPLDPDPAPAALSVKNRPFFAKLRNLHYRRAQEIFHGLHALSRHEPPPMKEILGLLEEHTGRLEATLQYADETIRGLKRNQLKMYRHDKANGVLEEEIVLCHFLEEMISSSRFLSKRLETDSKINVYSRKLKRYLSPGGSGFLANILDSLDAMNRTESLEIEKILGVMEERYRIGDQLFDIILNRAGRPRDSEEGVN